MLLVVINKGELVYPFLTWCFPWMLPVDLIHFLTTAPCGCQVWTWFLSSLTLPVDAINGLAFLLLLTLPVDAISSAENACETRRSSKKDCSSAGLVMLVGLNQQVSVDKGFHSLGYVCTCLRVGFHKREWSIPVNQASSTWHQIKTQPSDIPPAYTPPPPGWLLSEVSQMHCYPCSTVGDSCPLWNSLWMLPDRPFPILNSTPCGCYGWTWNTNSLTNTLDRCCWCDQLVALELPIDASEQSLLFS